MKLLKYIRKKQLGKRILSAAVVASLLVAVPLVDGIGNGGWFASMKAYATSATQKKNETQNKLDDTNSQIDELQGIQNQIDGQLNEKAQELASIVASQQLLQADMDDTQAQIDQANIDLVAAQKQETKQYDSMKLRIQFMYENGSDDSIWTAILESDGIADMLNRIEYVSQVHSSDRDMLNTYEEAVQQVTDLKAQLEMQMADMESMQASYQEQQNALDAVVADLKSQSADYETQIANAKTLANQYAQTVAQQKAIEREEERKRAEEAAKQQQQSASNSNSNSGSGNTSSSTSQMGGAGYLKDDSNNPSSSVSGSSIVSFANQYVGNSYVWGGTSLTNGCDCSGFVYRVMEHFGYNFSYRPTSSTFGSWGNPVSYNNMQAGDVVVYPGHVAIYMGNGKIVEAQSTSAGITNYRSVNCHTITAIRRAP